MLNELLVGAVGAVGVPLLFFLWSLFLKREKVVGWGKTIGTLCRTFLFQKLGNESGGKVSGRLSTTIDDLTFGVRWGLTNEEPPKRNGNGNPTQ